MITDTDKIHLKRCITLAKEALEAGDEPFGSVLVDDTGTVLFEERNRVNTLEATYHPEIAIARWAAQNMSAKARQKATVYTSGEHCPMCAAAHGWVGLGRIIYISSAEQLSQWLEQMGVEPPPINMLPIESLVPDVTVIGPITEFEKQIKNLHEYRHKKDSPSFNI